MTEEAREWQPIETAPRDSTAVLGYAPFERGPLPVVMFWYDGAWRGVESERYVDDAMSATHWMPLPTPPQDSERSEG